MLNLTIIGFQKLGCQKALISPTFFSFNIWVSKPASHKKIHVINHQKKNLIKRTLQSTPVCHFDLLSCRFPSSHWEALSTRFRAVKFHESFIFWFPWIAESYEPLAQMQVIFTFYTRGGNKINSRLAKAASFLDIFRDARKGQSLWRDWVLQNAIGDLLCNLLSCTCAV